MSRSRSRWGFGKDDPADLARFAGDFALHFLDPEPELRMTDLVELSRLGTAMMLIRRDVLETLTRHASRHRTFRPDPAERAAHGVGRYEAACFSPMVEAETQALLSDDYAFCRRVRDAGFRIWLAPWVSTTHSGPAIFRGSLTDVAQLLSTNSASSPE
jgi:hypothetical protein